MNPQLKLALQMLALLAALVGLAVVAGAPLLQAIGVFAAFAIPILIFAWRDRHKPLY